MISSRDSIFGLAFVGVLAFSSPASAQKIIPPPQETYPQPTTNGGMGGGVQQQQGEITGMSPNGQPIYGNGQQQVQQNPYDQAAARRQQQQQPSRLTTVGPNCPFRPDDTQVIEIWATAREALQGMEARNQACKNALNSLTAGIESTENDRPRVDEERIRNEERIRTVEAEIITLSASNEPSAADALERAHLRLRTLRSEFETSDRIRNANSDAASQEATISRLRAVLRAVPSVQAQCQGADANIAAAATQTGLNLFASASPMIFGAASSIGTIASLLGNLVGALVGPSREERGLQYMTRVEDFNNLACFYFHTQRVYCNGTRNSAADDPDPNLSRLEDVRSLFESGDAPIGRRMRNLFNDIYGDSERALGPRVAAFIPQYCGLMSAVPGRTDRCTTANRAGLGATNASCTYMEYYEAGTTAPTTGGSARRFPSAPPSGALSTSTSGASR